MHLRAWQLARTWMGAALDRACGVLAEERILRLGPHDIAAPRVTRHAARR